MQKLNLNRNRNENIVKVLPDSLHCDNVLFFRQFRMSCVDRPLGEFRK